MSASELTHQHSIVHALMIRTHYSDISSFANLTGFLQVFSSNRTKLQTSLNTCPVPIPKSRKVRLICIAILFFQTCLRLLFLLILFKHHIWASQVALVVKNLPANTADMRCRFDPCVRKIPWRRAWQPTPVFLPGEPYEQRSLAGYIHTVT